MSWESSVCAESSLPNMPWAIPCTLPARPWRGSTRTWCAFQCDRERPSIRSPRRRGSVSGNFSLPCPVNLPESQLPRTSQPAPQPGWEVKAFCRSAAAWGPRPPAMERIIKFQPLRSTPSPSVRLGRKSRGQERSEGGGNDLRHHSPSHSEGQATFLDDKTEPPKEAHLGMGRGRGPDPGGGEARGRRKMSHSHPVHGDDKQHVLEVNALVVTLRAFHVWPSQRKPPWETDFHTQSRRL